jgi:hypothetical protein
VVTSHESRRGFGLGSGFDSVPLSTRLRLDSVPVSTRFQFRLDCGFDSVTVATWFPFRLGFDFVIDLVNISTRTVMIFTGFAPK